MHRNSDDLAKAWLKNCQRSSMWYVEQFLCLTYLKLFCLSASGGGATSTGQMVVSDPDSEDDEDDDREKRHSSDSDEDDLASLPRIHQQPETTSVLKAAAAEDMDVSSTDGIYLYFIIKIVSTVCVIVYGGRVLSVVYIVVFLR